MGRSLISWMSGCGTAINRVKMGYELNFLALTGVYTMSKY